MPELAGGNKRRLSGRQSAMAMADLPTASEICTIGRDVVIRGNLSGTEDTVIQGRVEGNITLAQQLAITSSGVVEADIEADSLIVGGTVSGQIRSSSKVAIEAEARVVGNIIAPSVSIADGAVFSGRIEMDVELPEGVVVPQK